MDKRTGLTILGMAGFVALAAGSRPRRSSFSIDASSTGPVTTTTAAATASSAAPEAEDVPDPTTDYKALDDAKLDGKKAYGKTVLLRVWRGSTDPATTTLFACGSSAASGFLTVKYTPEQRAKVQSIPTTIPFHSHCPRAVIKITGKETYGDDLRGELQQILDVTPKTPATLPPGVDYVSLDDIYVDGKKAAGKVALLNMYRGTTEEKKFTGYPCGDSGAGGLNFVYVNFTPEQKEEVKSVSSSVLTCQKVKIKLTSQQAYTSTWNANLLDVEKE